MIKYKKGNLLQAETQALVNTVNTVGVMGKGIALQFKENFPNNYREYSNAYKEGRLKIGHLIVVREDTLQGEKIIINFPTKTEWYKKSQYDFIEKGLKELVEVINEYKISSIAIPPLGCGNGGLRWSRVKELMEEYLKNVDSKVIIYQPNEDVKKVLQKETTQKKSKLTPARAMLIYAMSEYEKSGEISSLFIANKLAYFLQESGEHLRLNFLAHKYGPYALGVEKVLYTLNGEYIKGLEQMKAKAFEPLHINYAKLDAVKQYIKNNISELQKSRLRNVANFIKGFESTLSIEVLASVLFLFKQNKDLKNEDYLKKIQEWNDRKKTLIKSEYIDIALDHIKSFDEELNPLR